MTLKKLIEINGLSMQQAAQRLGVDKSQVIKVCNHTYTNWESKEPQFIQTLIASGCHEDIITHGIEIDTNILVLTKSVRYFQALADDLSDPASTMSSSIGMVIGTAERGKTHSAKWYCEQNSDARYVLFIDGSSRVQLLRDVCEAVANTRPYSFNHCIQTLVETCRYNRHLVIIDEADKLPVPFLEMIRGVNEKCSLPFLLVGEEELKHKTDRVARLRSRIRQPIVVFDKASSLDVAAYYHEAAGIDITQEQAQRLVEHAKFGFRSIVNDSIAISKMARASGLSEITPQMLRQLCHREGLKL